MYLQVIAGSRSEGTQGETEEEKIPVKGVLLIWVPLWATGAQCQWEPSEKQRRLSQLRENPEAGKQGSVHS